jgi:hypothetical protein
VLGPSRLLRLLAFAIPAVLALTAVQPLLASMVGSVSPAWALSLAGPSLAVAAAVYLTARLTDRGDVGQPPWYSAWVLLPGAFLLAGAASMCVLGALVVYPPTRRACWELLAAGLASWSAGIALVRWRSTDIG